MKQFILPFVLIFCLAGFVQAQIEIDGDMLDWDGIPRADVGETEEPIGDMLKGADYDLNGLYITSNDSMLFLRITIDPAGSLVNGYTNGLAFDLFLDTDIANSSGVNWGWYTIGGDYYIDVTPAAAGEFEGTIRYSKLNAPPWPTGYDSLGQVQVAMNEGGTEVEVGIELSYLNAWHSVRPFVQITGAWDWDNPDGMPNGQYMWEDAYMIDYNLHTKQATKYLARGTRIEDAIEIDGDMLDWSGLTNVDVGVVAEELGDMETGPDFDVMDWWMASDSANVYIRIDIDPTGTFSGQYTKYDNAPVFELQFETVMSDSVGLSWGNWWHMGGDYKVNLTDVYNPDSPQNTVTLWKYAGTSNEDEAWDSLSVCVAAVDENDNKIEIAVPRALIQADGSEVRPFIYSVGNENWDAEEYFPDDIIAEEGPAYVLNYNFMTGAAPYQVMAGDPQAIGSHDAGRTPTEFSLDQNYPNPFNPATNIRFTLPVADNVNIVIFDVLGRQVATLANNQPFGASTHVVTWNGLNDAGYQVGSGVYFYQIATSQYSATKKMILMK